MNKSMAALYFKLSADQGDAAAQHSYAACLLEGDGVTMNRSAAVHYFKLSAEQGDPVGQYGYGVCLANGLGLPMNRSMAAGYFKIIGRSRPFFIAVPIWHVPFSW
jgi:TPR repeat protein